MELTRSQEADLRALTNSWDVPASIATRARIVLWRAEGRQKQEVAALAGVSPDPQLHPALELQPHTVCWTATVEEILAKVRLVQANIKKLVDNNAK